MIKVEDEKILQQKGITSIQIEEQLNIFKTGFPFLQIQGAASTGHGILHLNQTTTNEVIEKWNTFLSSDKNIVKFVPASGAASRMFKDLFEFIDAPYDQPQKQNEIYFFEHIQQFAFYNTLNECCKNNEGKTILQLIQESEYKLILKNLLLKQGLNYGSLPKGLLLFHSYANERRTPMQEHFVEGVLYTASEQKVKIHFTVSEEHKTLFEKHCLEFINEYEQKYNLTFDVGFSVQKPSTDTIAANENNEPFRENGQLLFRPGGHGALIENLNDIDAEIIFIKNIDNVVPDKLKETTVTYKRIIAGLLISIQEKIFEYIKLLLDRNYSPDLLFEISNFCEFKLNIKNPRIDSMSEKTLVEYLLSKLNRPIRVCGMVKNTGEPGGGPFWTVNEDKTISLQILESSQIDINNPAEKEKMTQSTHFNPVDLVCGVRNYKGEKFNLLKYVDKKTGFISSKSKNGKELKALELPGLWNGAMSDWNTIFVEVPIETFNPVKTVNDLLRPEHQ